METTFVKPEILTLVTSRQAWNYRIIPFFRENEKLSVYSDNAELMAAPEELSIVLGLEVSIEPVAGAELEEMLVRYYRKARDSNESFQPGSSDILQLLGEARELGSSDVHIEIYKARARIRFRIDGHLVERYTIETDKYQSLINKVKISSGLDISEKRLPQDGRIQFESNGKAQDIRVSIIPTIYGEKAVLRILGADASKLSLESLGMSDTDIEHYLEALGKPNGIILISGPTGSGKTTTLYASLKKLNTENRNIMTIEDPIEYLLDGINQVQLKEQIGLSFASALRSFLRQDPDVIMVGEIRDPETAQMAMRASLTGHLVLSTIHTNDAPGIITRLTDMGIPPYLLAGTLNLAVAQRLVRLLCAHCKATASEETLSLARKKNIPVTAGKIFDSKGCTHCHYTGYKGRIAVYEVLPVTPELMEVMSGNAAELTAHLKKNNIRRLSDSALTLINDGMTSVQEVYSLLK